MINYTMKYRGAICFMVNGYEDSATVLDFGKNIFHLKVSANYQILIIHVSLETQHISYQKCSNIFILCIKYFHKVFSISLC
jgi:hypothetical protein